MTPVCLSSDYIIDYRNKCNELIISKSLDEEKRLWQLFDANLKYQMRSSPESATWRGYPGQNHRWSDLSLNALEKGKEVDENTHDHVSLLLFGFHCVRSKYAPTG